MKVVRNDVVSLNWDAEGFVQHKKEGFIGCTFETGGTCCGRVSWAGRCAG